MSIERLNPTNQLIQSYDISRMQRTNTGNLESSSFSTVSGAASQISGTGLVSGGTNAFHIEIEVSSNMIIVGPPPVIGPMVMAPIWVCVDVGPHRPHHPNDPVDLATLSQYIRI